MDTEKSTTPPPPPQQQPESVSAHISTAQQSQSRTMLRQRQLAPPSPASAMGKGARDTTPSSSPAEDIMPASSPAWESGLMSEHSIRQQQQHDQKISTAVPVAPNTAPAGTTTTARSDSIFIDSTSHSLPNKMGTSPLSITGDEQSIVTLANLQSSEWVISAPPQAAVATPSPPPSAGASNEDDQISAAVSPSSAAAAQQQPAPQLPRRAFFPSSSDSAEEAPVSAMREEEPCCNSRTTPWRDSGEEDDDPSIARSAGSGIFELEIASPDVEYGTTPQTVVTGDVLQAPRNKENVWAESNHSGTGASISTSRSATSALRGPWGRLQEVIDEIKVFTPQRDDAGRGTIPTTISAPTTSSQESHFLHPTASPPVPPTVEESKVFSTVTAHPNVTDTPEGIHPAQEQRAPYLSKFISPSPSPIPLVERTREPPRATRQTDSQPTDASFTTGAPVKDKQLEDYPPPPPLQHQSEAKIRLPVSAKKQQQTISSPSPLVEDEAIECSPVVLASSATEKEQGDAASLKWRATPEQTSPEQRTGVSQQHTTCPVDSSSAVQVKNQQQRQRGSEDVSPEPQPQELPPGALLAPESREATFAWVAALEPSAAHEKGNSEKDAASSESGSGFDIGWGRGWGIRGDSMEADNTEELLGTGWDPRRGVGERLMKAAEAISSSPQLRRAAGVATSAVTSAAGTARVNFTRTSRTITKVLMASAKSFEEFVGEQLRQDGSGQVLRREGATGLLVPRGKALTQAFVVGAGCYLCWEFRVKDYDLGFALRLRTQGIGGSKEEDIFEMKRYPSGETFQGSWTAETESTAVVIMVFDNSYSCLRPKTLAYKAHVLKPAVNTSGLPPPPPPTPAAGPDPVDISPPSTRVGESGQEEEGSSSEGGGGGGGWQGGRTSYHAAYTEAFAIDDLDNEDTYFSGSNNMGARVGEDERRSEGNARAGGGMLKCMVASSVGESEVMGEAGGDVQLSYGSSDVRTGGLFPAAGELEEKKRGEEHTGDRARSEEESGVPETIQLEDFLGT